MNRDALLRKLLANKAFKTSYYRLKKNKIDKNINVETAARLIGVTIKQERGCVGNKVIIGKNTNITNSSIEFHGNNNTVVIGEKGQIGRNNYLIYDDNNTLEIGDRLNSDHDTTIAVLEGGRVTIGDDCLFSYGIEIRNSDSHSLLDKEGTRTNHAEDVTIGNHVWIAQRALILKGADIQNNCVIAANALITRGCYTEKSLWGGVPAKALKMDIQWDINRL